jgi:anti-sigma factor RsiW
MNEPAADEMTCQELVELVTDYLEDALAAPERGRFEAHLSKCPGCQTYVEQMRTTIQLTGELEPASLSREACETLLATFRKWKVEASYKRAK